jgi:hypothetical protein
MIGPRIISRHILPPGGMTPDEARGFRMACACFATWGMQLAAEPTLPGPPHIDQVRARFRAHGRVVAAMASALDRQLGRPPAPADIPTEALTEISAST